METVCSIRNEIVRFENVSYQVDGETRINDLSLSICIGEDIVFFGTGKLGDG